MKIGILTQPLGTNYGGILQNYALQTALKKYGFDPFTINHYYPHFSKIMNLASIIKRNVLKYIFRRNVILRIKPTKKEAQVISRNIDQFVKRNINLTEKIYKSKKKIIKKYDFNTYIVGSDQVWRPKYSHYLDNFFLDFLDGNNEIKKITYAASFGVDDWEYTSEQTIKYSRLAKQFKAISVREESGIELCRKHLDVEAVQVLDPTMLLRKEDYIDLAKRDNIPERENLLFGYILDNSEEKNVLIEKIIKEFNLKYISGMPSNSFDLKMSKKDLSDCIFMPVTEWIAGFRDAKFVITDSFHGTIFSIIFNKPFIVFSNTNRGKARFMSLLKMFKLEDRLITTPDFDNKLLHLDYSEINKTVDKERNKSINYLLDALQK